MVNRVPQEYRVPLVSLVQVDFQEVKVHRVHKVHRVNVEGVVTQDQMEMMALTAHLDLKDHRVRMDSQAHQVHKDLLVQ